MSNKISTSSKKFENYKNKMALHELKFNGSNGHSKIWVMPSHEEVTFHLIRVGDLTLLDLSRNRNKRLGESEKEFQLKEIEYHSILLNASYFARSEEHEGYLGVQYYRAATSEDILEDRIPVGAPQILTLPHLTIGNYNQNSFLEMTCKTKGATTYVQIRDICDRVALVQYYKPRQII